MEMSVVNTICLVVIAFVLVLAAISDDVSL